MTITIADKTWTIDGRVAQAIAGLLDHADEIAQSDKVQVQMDFAGASGKLKVVRDFALPAPME